MQRLASRNRARFGLVLVDETSNSERSGDRGTSGSLCHSLVGYKCLVGHAHT